MGRVARSRTDFRARPFVPWPSGRSQATRPRSAGRTLQSSDAGRRVFALSIGPDRDLAMALAANGGVKLRRALEAGATAIGVIGVLLLLVRWRPRRAVFPLILTAFALLVVALIDVTFIGGFRPLDAGDDGLVYPGFACAVVAPLVPRY